MANNKLFEMSNQFLKIDFNSQKKLTKQDWESHISNLSEENFLTQLRILINKTKLSVNEKNLINISLKLTEYGDENEFYHKEMGNLREFSRKFIAKIENVLPVEELFENAVDCQISTIRRYVHSDMMVSAKKYAIKTLVDFIKKFPESIQAKNILYKFGFIISILDPTSLTDVYKALKTKKIKQHFGEAYLYTSLKRECNKLLNILSLSDCIDFKLSDAERGRVIGIHSIKGGVGKTLIGCAIAVILAEQGRKVCIVDADTTGPSLMFNLSYPVLFPYKWNKNNRFPFFHNIIMQDDLDNIDRYLFTPEIPPDTSGSIKTVVGCFRPAVVTDMDRYQRTDRAPKKARYNEYSFRLAKTIEVLITKKKFDHVIIDTSPGVVGTSYATINAVLGIGGAMIFVTHPRVPDIVGSCIEYEAFIDSPFLKKRGLLLINSVAVDSSIDYTNVDDLMNALENWEELTAFTNGHPFKSVLDGLRKILSGMQKELICLNEFDELRKQNQVHSSTNLFNLFRESTLQQDFMPKIINLLKQFEIDF